MNRSQTKIRKIQEANKMIENRFLLSEKYNPITGEDVVDDKTLLNKKLPTDYTKNITFLFPDKTSVTIKPIKQDISKAIIDSLETEGLVTKNTVDLSRQGASQKICTVDGVQKVYILTKPNKFADNWCKFTNVGPEFFKNNGIFEIPNKYEFVSIGKSISEK